MLTLDVTWQDMLQNSLTCFFFHLYIRITTSKRRMLTHCWQTRWHWARGGIFQRYKRILYIRLQTYMCTYFCPLLVYPFCHFDWYSTFFYFCCKFFLLSSFFFCCCSLPSTWWAWDDHVVYFVSVILRAALFSLISYNFVTSCLIFYT